MKNMYLLSCVSDEYDYQCTIPILVSNDKEYLERRKTDIFNLSRKYDDYSKLTERLRDRYFETTEIDIYDDQYSNLSNSRNVKGFKSSELADFLLAFITSECTEEDAREAFDRYFIITNISFALYPEGGGTK